MKNILVTGANGQLGNEMQALQNRYPEFNFNFYTRDNLDISNDQAVETVFSSLKPAYCINCAAYTAVDKAESENEAAFLINETGVANLATASIQFHTRLIHISTDYVFDGNGKKPYKEEVPVDPINTYGKSKLAGEKRCFEINPQSIIIRTSWVYSEFGNNFVKTMLRLMQVRDSLNVVADQYGIPTYAADLADAIMFIVSFESSKPGIYHYSNAGKAITWFDFAKEIQEYTQATCDVKPIPTSAYPTPARRPLYSVLDTRKITSEFNITIPQWKESLHICLDKLKETGSW